MQCINGVSSNPVKGEQRAKRPVLQCINCGVQIPSRENKGLSDWCCSVSIVRVQIPSREGKILSTLKSNSNTVGLNFQTCMVNSDNFFACVLFTLFLVVFVLYPCMGILHKIKFWFCKMLKYHKMDKYYVFHFKSYLFYIINNICN